MRRKKPSRAAAAGMGLLGGLVGTVAMTALQEAASRARGRSQLEQQAKPPRTWAQAPPAAQVGKLVSERLFSHRVTKKQAPVLGSAVHWAYGTALGGLYGLLVARSRRSPALQGLAFGTGVWGLAYLMLPALRIYKPIWQYPVKTLAIDLSYHLAYGVSVARAYEALTGSRRLAA
jgi:uncharacterized membrane protein YagU involved in acid resistance